MLYRSSAPAKIILFGEWAVLHGASGVGMAVAPRLEICWKQAEYKKENAVLLLRGDNQMGLWDPNEALAKQSQVPPFFHKLVQLIEALAPHSEKLKEALRYGGELKVERHWPLDFGLGSSSAIVACLMELFDSEKERLHKWKWGLESLKKVQGAASGLDLAIQLRGGCVSLSEGRPRPLANVEIPSHIFFIHAGQKADTSFEIKKAPLSADQIQKLAQSAKGFLEKGDWSLAIREHADALKDSELWPKNLRSARNEWMESGLIRNMKSCGAGGGDTWMVDAEPSNKSALQTACEKNSWQLRQYTIESRGVENLK